MYIFIIFIVTVIADWFDLSVYTNAIKAIIGSNAAIHPIIR